jgi:hypothetical protein
LPQPEIAQLQCSCTATAACLIAHLHMPQVTLRVQLDLIALAPDVIYYSDMLNQRIKQIFIVLDYTPLAHQQSDVHLAGVSTPQADARITDVSGTGDHLEVNMASAASSGSPFFMFYRTDIFSSARIPVPETWEELLEAAQALNGTDFDGDGAPDHSVCFSAEPICSRSQYVLLSILGPMLQAAAPSQGVFFDPLTMQPLMGTPAMFQALTIYASLSRFVDLTPGTPCSPYSVPFATGTPCCTCPTALRATECTFTECTNMQLIGMQAQEESACCTGASAHRRVACACTCYHHHAYTSTCCQSVACTCTCYYHVCSFTCTACRPARIQHRPLWNTRS